MLHREIVFDLVVAIPILCKIVSTNGQSAKRKTAAFFPEEIIVYCLALLLWQRRDRLDAKLGKASAKAVQRPALFLANSDLYSLFIGKIFVFLPLFLLS